MSSARASITLSSRGRPRARRATVVVVGSINTDLVIRVPHLPAPGETLQGSGFSVVPGGKGANQAVATARLGGRAVMIGAVGDDVFGPRLRRGLTAEGVNTRHVLTLPRASSGTAVISVDDAGQNSIALAAGANGLLRPAHVRAAEEIIARADALLVQLEIPLETVAAALRLAARHGVPTVLDAAPVPEGGLPRGFPSVDILTPNQSEAELLTGIRCSTLEEATAAGLELVRRYDPGLAILKLGADGAMAHGGVGAPLHYPTFPVKVVDTTAAGDAFTAALTLRLAEGATLGAALPFACAAGALATTRLGAQSALPLRAAVDRLLRRSPN